MFEEKEENKLKIEEIRLSPELLRINSGYEIANGPTRIVLILIVSLVLIFYKDLSNIIKDKTLDEQLVLVSMAVLFLGAFFFTLFNMHQNSGKILIMTEKGLFIEPVLAEFWKDVSGYRWEKTLETIKGFHPEQSEETSVLLFNNNSSWPKTYDVTRYGIFFTASQVQQVDDICSRMGIKKLAG